MEKVRAYWLAQLSLLAHEVQNVVHNLESQSDIPAIVPQGLYGFTVTARDPADKPVSANTYVFGQVTGVNFDSGNANLLVDGKEIGQNKLKGIYR